MRMRDFIKIMLYGVSYKMKANDFDPLLHCINCKGLLQFHDWEDDLELGFVLKKFGRNCNRASVDFEDQERIDEQCFYGDMAE